MIKNSRYNIHIDLNNINMLLPFMHDAVSIFIAEYIMLLGYYV